MNDVLAKPFTKDGMVRILKKHLTYMLRDSPPPGTVMGSEDIVQNGGTPVSAAPGSTQSFGGPATMTLAHMVGPMATGGPGKFENTPIQSPATSASWHSPNQMTHTSPQMDGGGYMNAVSNGNGGMLLTPGGSTQRTQFPPTQSIPQGSTSTLGRMAEDLGHGDDRPDKRQRIFGPSQGAFV